MTRTAAREIAVMLCFREAANPEGEPFESFFDRDYFLTLAQEDRLFTVFPEEAELDYIKRLTSGVAARREELDAFIEKYARHWKIGRISRIASAIMRVAMFEVMYLEEVPDSAAINEAVEIAKGYEEPETVAFINGILGSFYRAEINKSDADEI